MGDAPAERRSEFLTSKQLADVLQVSEATVRRLRRRGAIPSIQVTDRIVRFNLRDVRTALSRAAKARAEAQSQPAQIDDIDRAQMNFSELLVDFDAGE